MKILPLLVGPSAFAGCLRSRNSPPENSQGRARRQRPRLFGTRREGSSLLLLHRLTEPAYLENFIRLAVASVFRACISAALGFVPFFRVRHLKRRCRNFGFLLPLRNLPNQAAGVFLVAPALRLRASQAASPRFFHATINSNRQSFNPSIRHPTAKSQPPPKQPQPEACIQVPQVRFSQVRKPETLPARTALTAVPIRAPK
ncbi:hypothetical protein B0J13DRAFT_177112 [Dactylonectria estremocensis]|uniref:Uncharacterized protein n=1 Tax=Dactylonectria estremocensis TaxID=1079267 RepID=A0A9P9F9C5_9HYPO|nr:hypothetical protein B0J13DRAFT_177112 [Dactylonectria estremocensis]